jgi:hypothetical protein
VVAEVEVGLKLGTLGLTADDDEDEEETADASVIPSFWLDDVGDVGVLSAIDDEDEDEVAEEEGGVEEAEDPAPPVPPAANLLLSL